MQLLFDYSQIVISSAVEYNSQTREPISLDLLRHIALQNIQLYKIKFNASLDQMIICCDGRNYWRKVIFPQYKQNRKREQTLSKFDWNGFFEMFNVIKTEMKTELPFRVIEVDCCEADDIIAVLSRVLCPSEDKIIVISSDKDLLQIQENICPKVRQWSPYHKKFINIGTNDYNLFEHVVRGDSGDGVPNILSDDDVFVTSGTRSRPIRASSIQKWMSEGGLSNPEAFCETPEILSRFNRNRTLIDLRQIPDQYVKEIAEAYQNESRPQVSAFNYLVKNKLRKILERGGI